MLRSTDEWDIKNDWIERDDPIFDCSLESYQICFENMNADKDLLFIDPTFQSHNWTEEFPLIRHSMHSNLITPINSVFLMQLLVVSLSKINLDDVWLAGKTSTDN